MEKRPHLRVAGETSTRRVLQIAPQQKAVDPFQQRPHLAKFRQRREQPASLVHPWQACQVRLRARVQRVQRTAVSAQCGTEEGLRIALIGEVAGNAAHEPFLRVLVQIGQRVSLLDILSPREDSLFLGGSQRARGVWREGPHERDHQQPSTADVA